MTLRLLAPGETLALARGTPMVCILPGGDDHGLAHTLRGVAAHTPESVPVLVVASVEGLDALAAALGGETVQTRALLALELSAGAGFAAAVNAASAIAGSGDLVLLAPGVGVGPSWLELLARAASCDSTVISASALHDGHGPLGVAVEVHPGEQAVGAQPDAALAVASFSPKGYPRLGGAGAECVYLRREVFDRIGALDTSLTEPDAALAALSRRALGLGMLHVAADDVFVTLGDAGRSDGEQPLVSPAGEEPPVSPADEEPAPVRRAIWCARSALQGISVTIDARGLVPGAGGTQRYTAELILALAADARLRVRAVVAPDLPVAVASRFRAMPTLEVISYEQAAAGVALTDVVHRPQQVFSEQDLTLLQMLGERVVVGQQDLIAYRNPSYHESYEHWQGHRRVTRLALTVADRVVFFSEHARRDAISEDLLGEQQGALSGIGADAPEIEPVLPAAPAGAETLGDQDLLVCIGADYAHKNRPFALALLHALGERHAWNGTLVLAGAHVAHGSSREEEAEFLARHPELADRVVDLGPVSEGVKAWLYQRARAVVYPTLYEGFGLIPFEAARAGAPCLYAPQASLVELAGAEAATLIPWNSAQSSDVVVALLHDSPERDRHLRMLLDASAGAKWSGVVEGLLDTYRSAVRSPYRAGAARAWEELQREQLLATFARNAESNNRAYNDLMSKVGIGLPLVQEGGLLTRDQQRGLMRVASRRPLRRLILGPLGSLGRLGRAHAPAAAEPELQADAGATGGPQGGSYDGGTRW